ncbi:glycosyltransferase [Candidatus Pacearchaeota archaeon]|nr:glycosyltransferase [Candidatus Pacearchaeota archaeon]
MKFSIIIPVKDINNYILEFVPKLLKQSYKSFEIIILPNEKPKQINSVLQNEKIKIIGSGFTGPAQKRNLGAQKSDGEILVFIDDDAYPVEDKWLEKVLDNFQTKDIVAVGGPQFTPPESNFFQKLSGKLFESFMISGPVSFRHKSAHKKICYDLPSCNLFVKKKDFFKAGGFDTEFWPGEDTKLCLEIKKLRGKIIYSPNVKVYHHRRKNLKQYIKQIFNYSKHRGYFAKKYPETSFKLSYFVPSLFVIGLINGIFISFFSSILRTIYFSILGLYFLLMFIEGVRTKKISYIIHFILVGFMTHIVYGVGFILGLTKKELKSKYRK